MPSLEWDAEEVAQVGRELVEALTKPFTPEELAAAKVQVEAAHQAQIAKQAEIEKRCGSDASQTR